MIGGQDLIRDPLLMTAPAMECKRRSSRAATLATRLQELADVELDGHDERVQKPHVAAPVDLVQVVILIRVLRLPTLQWRPVYGDCPCRSLVSSSMTDVWVCTCTQDPRPGDPDSTNTPSLTHGDNTNGAS